MARDGGGRGDWNARQGSRNSGPYAGGSGDTGPVDIAAVRRDDALIDAIAGDGQVQTDSTEEFQLAALLADWRAEIIEPALPAGPDLDAVVAAVNQEIGARKVRVGAQSGTRLRLVRPILGTAAALALVIGGLTAFSYNAEPGNPLWRVKEVVFSEQAQTTVANRAGDQIDQAEQLIAKNDPVAAKAQLEAAQANVDQVTDPVKKAKLQADWQQLLAELQKAYPEVGAQISTQARSTEPKPAPGSSNNVTTPGQQPASQTTPDRGSVMQAPIETSASPKPPTQQLPPPTQPVEPGTSVPPVTQEPPTQAPPTQAPPSQEVPTHSPPTTVNSPSVPTGGVEIPTQPTNQVPNTGLPIPSIPFTLPGRPG